MPPSGDLPATSRGRGGAAGGDRPRTNSVRISERRDDRSLRGYLARPSRLAASAWLARRTSARLRRDLAALAARPEPIVVGPWLGEVGFELLYWIPFVAWFAECFDVPRERLLVLSRGGTWSMYAPFA